MSANRWNLLAHITEKCEYTSPDRFLTRLQALQLFHVFLLQTKESAGTVFFIGTPEQNSFATYFAQAFLTDLKIASKSLTNWKEITKNDLLISLTHFRVEGIVSEFDFPLISLNGGSADLSISFKADENSLHATAQYLFLKTVIDTWSFEPIFPTMERAKTVTIPKVQIPSTQIML